MANTHVQFYLPTKDEKIQIVKMIESLITDVTEAIGGTRIKKGIAFQCMAYFAATYRDEFIEYCRLAIVTGEQPDTHLENLENTLSPIQKVENEHPLKNNVATSEQDQTILDLLNNGTLTRCKSCKTPTQTSIMTGDLCPKCIQAHT